MGTVAWVPRAANRQRSSAPSPGDTWLTAGSATTTVSYETEGGYTLVRETLIASGVLGMYGANGANAEPIPVGEAARQRVWVLVRLRTLAFPVATIRLGVRCYDAAAAGLGNVFTNITTPAQGQWLDLMTDVALLPNTDRCAVAVFTPSIPDVGTIIDVRRAQLSYRPFKVWSM